MGLSSRSFIQLHALFQFSLAVYLTWTPETVVDSGFIFTFRDQPRIANIPPFTPPRSPFAYCGVILLIFALFDLSLTLNLPSMNRLLTVASCVRRDHREPGGVERPDSADQQRGQRRGSEISHVTAEVIKVASEFSALYRHIFTYLTVLRFCIYFIVSAKIFSLPESAWVGRARSAAPGAPSNPTDMITIGDLKWKIILGYGFMEVSFFSWVRF
ncbi:hypothetical protein LOZ53_002038 [Ophidiomyces ophidiicola]|uniref:Uncharacterized protein n=1 Tax=Ophidiomyces ophidiicola TaxID=1387563 RepID=A0ACB8UTM3_9EURO|nr:uncharacterized protein LOZ57_006347 [Ophidiomyces ophidiicola]KAI1907051.1 hypothetical protein LOZ64_006022 [Ophidiomyces ophidiicola]KAI1909343.1 hypothetical protein LOZ61_005079 [Ophidiomyces ophidiicola]KAI1921994.1 hypothetical protein LOZ60_005966 [Ophidiomyces ophidiicola]KAI1938385.1 hypothetical protein LOZ57_006347 [Ophidiomyces ophidiicola]KAI1945061.1 hypothetical protein LOZ62_003927 [Ophidiomyces ophidiicola]